jgi:hypothetical protein
VDRVPYRVTETNHILVRAKLNGKGPYNLILDTGAPAVYLLSKVAAEIGLNKADGAWATVEKVKFEGGAALANVRTRIEDPHQLIGMNAMNLPGVRLDGVLGYTALASFRIDIDLTRRYMLWRRLEFDPPPPPDPDTLYPPSAAAEAARGAQAAAALARVITAILKDDRPVVPRGYLGFEVEEIRETVAVKTVYRDSPAAKAGLFAGDVLVIFRGRPVATLSDLVQAANRVAPGDAVRIQIWRSGMMRHMTLKAGEGL